MISTQRLLLIVTMFNLMIGTVLDFNSISTIDFERLTQSQELGQNFAGNLTDSDLQNTAQLNQLQSEPTYGNALVQSSKIVSIFVKGFVPIPLQGYTFSNVLETIGSYIIGFIQSSFYIIIGIEIFLLLKNKKVGG